LWTNLTSLGGAASALALFMACSPPTPVQPELSRVVGAEPTAQLTVSIDVLGSHTAVVDLSPVTASAERSTGTDLRFQLDFGDGTVADERVAMHVYAAPGSYTVRATVVDALGRTATATTVVRVEAVAGTWVHAGYVTAARRVEVRRLVFEASSGPVLQGVLSATGRPEQRFRGGLVVPRGVRLVLADQAVLEGTVPDPLSDEGVVWSLRASGGEIDGETFPFKLLAGTPSGSGPDAVLRVSVPNFGRIGVDPVFLDGSTSRGEGLSHFIEFGDGEQASSATAEHHYPAPSRLVARLTVVDRFGRLDFEEATIRTESLIDGPGDAEHWNTNPGYPELQWIYVWFRQRAGHQVGGELDIKHRFDSSKDYRGRFTGSLRGIDEIELVTTDGLIRLRGRIQFGLPTIYQGRAMTLTLTGGALDGQTYSFFWYPGAGG
jgi:hypothetical protein